MIAAAARRAAICLDAQDRLEAEDRSDATGCASSHEYAHLQDNAQMLKVKEALDAAEVSGLLRAVPLLADWDTPLESHPAVRTMRLDHMTPTIDEGGAVELATVLGAQDHITIAIAGATGGAGVSILAVLIAHALWSADTPCVLAELNALTPGLDLVLGTEMDPGWRIQDMPAGVDLPPLQANLPEIFGSGSLLAAHGARHTNPHPGSTADDTMADTVADTMAWQAVQSTLALQWTVVADCGLYQQYEWDNMQAQLRVLLAPMTVLGVSRARALCDAAARQGQPMPLVLLREVPHAITTSNLAQLMLGAKPHAVIQDDPQIPVAVDTADLVEYLCQRYPSGHPVAHGVLRHLDRARAAGAAALEGLI